MRQDRGLGLCMHAGAAARSTHLSCSNLQPERADNIPTKQATSCSQGDLHVLADHSMINFNAADNPKLVRFGGQAC